MRSDPLPPQAPARASRCPICDPDSPRAAEVVRSGDLRVVRCAGCGLVRLAEFPDWSAVAPRLEDVGYGHNGEIEYGRRYTTEELARTRASRISEHGQRRLAAAVARAGLDVRSRLRMHDIGCSEGFSLYFACRDGWDASGNDVSPVRQEFGRRELGVDFTVGFFRDCAIAPGALDVVTMRHVLEHIPDPLAELSLVRERLASRGVLVVEVPNFRNPPLRLKVLRQRWGLRRGELEFMGLPSALPEHCWQFTSDTLARLLSKAGLSVREWWTSSTPTNHSTTVRALLGATLHRVRLGSHLVVLAQRA